MTDEDKVFAERRREAEEIADGERVAEFLRDPAVQRALAALNRQYFDEFKAASSREARDDAWAKARVVEDFGVMLQSVLDAGTRAKAQRNSREIREEQERKRKPR